MSIKTKTELLTDLVNLVRSNGQNGKTSAAEVRTLLTNLIDALFSRAGTVNGNLPDANGNINLTAIPTEVQRQFVVNPNLDTTDVVYLESGPVTFRVSYDEDKISTMNFRTRKKGETTWSVPVTLAGLNNFANSLSGITKFEVQVVPVFTTGAVATGEDILGLLIY